MAAGYQPRFSRGTWLLTWQLRSDTAPGGLFCQESASEGSDGCFCVSGETKASILDGDPWKMKLYSEFLGKRPWFAGDKVSGMALGRRAVIS